MKRVVNTILQLFDYLPQSSIVIAATNQKDMLDEALIRRFDNIVEFKLPNEKEIKELIALTLKNGVFSFDKKNISNKIIKECFGLSYYSIQKTLITAIKRSLFATKEPEKTLSGKIDTQIWKDLVEAEKQALNKQELYINKTIHFNITDYFYVVYCTQFIIEFACFVFSIFFNGNCHRKRKLVWIACW